MRRILLLSCFLLTSCTGSSQSTQPTPTSECGVERWHVKSLIDADTSSINFTPVVSSIALLTSAPRQAVNTSASRFDFEKQAVSIQATVVAYKAEDDGDVHLLLQDSLGNQMIAEVPDPSVCSELLKSSHAIQFDSVQTWIANNLGHATSSFKDASIRVTVVGIPFQDYSHGQRGEAPNSREIHPILNIH